MVKERLSFGQPNDSKGSASLTVKELPVQAFELDQNFEDVEIEVGWRTWLTVFAAMSCAFMGYWLTIQTAFFSSPPASALNAGTRSAWLANGWPVFNASLGAAFAEFAEIFGRKKVILGGFTLATIGCILIGTAQDFRLVIVGSAFCGGVMTNQASFFSIPSEVLPRRLRGVGQSVMVCMGAVSSVICLVTNGALIQRYPVDGWRYGYYLSAGLTALAMCNIYVLYQPRSLSFPQGTTIASLLRHKVDWIGSLLQCAFVVPFMIALTWGGVAYDWSSAHVLGALVVGLVGLASLLAHQVFIKKDGVLNHGMFRQRNLSLALFGSFCEGVAFLTYNAFYTTQVSSLWDPSPLGQALRFMPCYIAFAISAPLFGLWTKRYQDVVCPLSVGWALVVVGSAMLGTAGRDDGWTSVGAVIVSGFGFGSLFALLVTMGQLGVQPQLLGLVTAQTAAVRALGIAVGTTVSTTLYETQLQKSLPTLVTNSLIASGLSAGPAEMVAQYLVDSNTTGAQEVAGLSASLYSTAMSAVVDAKAVALHVPWFWNIGLCSAAIVSTLCVDRQYIRRAMGWVVERPVEELQYVA